MVKTFTVYEGSRALVLVKAIMQDLRDEMEMLILLQSKGAFPTDKEHKQHVEKLKHHFEELKQLGCLSREPETGTVDFPSFYQGAPVFLCWKLGEETILHWHGLHENHENRHPITEEFLSENSKTAKAVA